MNSKKIFKQSLIFIMALFIIAMGVSLSVKADLGVSPISCIPYIYCLKSPLSLGITTIIFNIFLILLQVVIMRKNYKWFQMIQIPVVLIFGFFIDFTMHLISWLNPITYWGQLFVCCLGCLVLGVGVFLEVKANLTYLPAEGLAMAITKTFNIDFGKTKMGTDSSMVTLAVISSFLLMGGLYGVREGTVVAAVLVGYIVRFFVKYIGFMDNWLVFEA